jgi:uncharacterized protein
MMKIQLGGLSEGVHDYQFQVEASDLALPENFSKPVRVAVVLDKTGSQAFLRGQIQTTGTFLCDRCTSTFEHPVLSTYQMCYLPEGSDASETDPAELQVLTAGSTVIEITEDVRQTILLSVPLKLLCSENCEGLCPQCGTNLNVETCSCEVSLDDPRWESLRTLRKNN